MLSFGPSPKLSIKRGKELKSVLSFPAVSLLTSQIVVPTKLNPRAVAGYTLIELIAVIALLAILSTFFVSSIDFNASGETEAQLKDFESTVQYLLEDSAARNVTYELEFLPDGEGYRVLQILPFELGESRNVDFLKNLRSKKESSRLLQQQLNTSLENMSEEYRKADERESKPLEDLFYGTLFSGGNAIGRKIPPLDQPSLAEPKLFPNKTRLSRLSLLDPNQDPTSIESVIILPNPSQSDVLLSFQVADQEIQIRIDGFSRTISSQL